MCGCTVPILAYIITSIEFSVYISLWHLYLPIKMKFWKTELVSNLINETNLITIYFNIQYHQKKKKKSKEGNFSPMLKNVNTLFINVYHVIIFLFCFFFLNISLLDFICMSRGIFHYSIMFIIHTFNEQSTRAWVTSTNWLVNGNSDRFCLSVVT